MSVIGRRRRPRWLWFLIMITAIVLLVDLVVSTRSDEPSRRVAALTYLDRVRAQIEQSSRQGADVADVRANAAQLGRAGITRRLDRVARDATKTLELARAAEAPGELADARALLLTTLWLRARGTGAMKQALDAALGKQPPQGAIEKMADVGADLIAADRTYAGFLDALKSDPRARLDAGLPGRPWIDDPLTWQPAELAAFITALRNSAEVAPIHDTTIVLVTIEPAAVRKEPDGRLVLPQTGKLRLQVVVGNVGNEQERNLKVEVTLVPGGASTTARDFVNLAPGERKTVTLGGLVPIVDTPAALTVRIDSPPGEATPQDNQRVIPIVSKA